MDDTFQDLMQRLGTAINNAIMNSDEVDGALAQVRGSGIDVFLVLEATICVRSRDGEPIAEAGAGDEDEALDGADHAGSTAVEMSPEDRQFLKRLRISLDVDDSVAE